MAQVANGINIAENFNWLSRAYVMTVTDRWQTDDGWVTAYSELTVNHV